MKAEYFDALKRYDAEKGRYNTEVNVRNSRIETGKQKVKELNARFADWYYVISNDSFDKLRLNRASLIKTKEKTAEINAEEKTGEVKVGEPKKDAETKGEPEEPKKEELKKDDAKKDDVKKDGDAAKPADAEKPADSK